MRTFSDMFRPNYEVYAAGTWAASVVALIILRPPAWHILIFVSVFMTYFRGNQAIDLYKFWVGLNSKYLLKRNIKTILRNFRYALSKKSLWLGYGFEWNQSCAEIASHISARNTEELRDLPDIIKKMINYALIVPPHERNLIQKAITKFSETISPKDVVAPTIELLGQSWIHGVHGTEEVHVLFPLPAISGHTLIVGTTGAGKTRLYELLCSQMIHAGKCLICIDPKKDVQWRDRLALECKRTGRTFLNFDLARPSESVYINPLTNYNNLVEVAFRLGQLVDAEGTFAAFSTKTLAGIVDGMQYVGIRPNIRSLRRCVTLGVESLATQAFEKYHLNARGVNWDRDLVKPAATGAKKDTLDPRLSAMVDMYMKDGAQNNVHIDALDALTEMLRHNKEHYSKMVQSLAPIMLMLGTGEVGDLLSPDYDDENDPKTIWDFKKIIKENCVLYIGLDSLSNGKMAQAVGSIFLADLAATAGAFYNEGTQTNVAVIIDEAAEVVNDQTTQLLNKGRGAGFEMFLATQTIADFVVRYGNRDRAMQALGNLNNIIALRLKDVESADYVSKSFGRTVARRIDVSYSTGTESSSSITEFRGQTSRSMKTEEIALVSPDLLLKLPSLQYFASLGGGKVWKGRLPLILD